MTSAFEAPSPAERVFNRAFGLLVGLGLGLRHNDLLRGRGRRTGRTLSTPAPEAFAGIAARYPVFELLDPPSGE